MYSVFDSLVKLLTVQAISLFCLASLRSLTSLVQTHGHEFLALKE